MHRYSAASRTERNDAFRPLHAHRSRREMPTTTVRSKNFAAGAVSVIVVLLWLMVSAATAFAAVIPGEPLQVSLETSGFVQAQFIGSAHAELNHSDSLQHRSGLSYTSGTALCGVLYANPVVPYSGPTVTGGGTSASPYEITMSYLCGGLDVTQTLRYVNGDEEFLARYSFTNPGTEPVMFVATSRAVFAAAGANAARGFLDSAPPRVLGVFNDEQGSAGGFVEAADSPWPSFLEGVASWPPYDGVSADLDNTVDPALVKDPRAAVRFNRSTSSALAAGATQSFDLIWFFGRYDGLSLSPSGGSQPAGEMRSVTATSRNHGKPVAGGVVRYAITGANPSSGSVSTAADGTAAISWTGANGGADTLTAFIDADNNGAFDPDVDTQQTATFSWTPRPAPPTAPPDPMRISPLAPHATSPPGQPGCPRAGNVIIGSAASDTRTGTPTTDIIFGLAGNDVLRAAGGDDCLYGSAGDDRLFGGAGADRLFGGSGADRVFGGRGNDRLRGDAGADRLSDKRGTDHFSGGGGNDVIYARDATPRDRRRPDHVRCGRGRDVASVDRRDRVARDCERVRRR